MRGAITSVCVGLTLIGGLGGVALLVAPANAGVPTASATSPFTMTRSPDNNRQAGVLLEYGEIARSNIFARERTPPAARYERASLTATVADQPTPAAAPVRFTLYGVATGPSGSVALIDADRTIPGAEIYRPGDKVGDYILDRVGETSVTLRNATESLVLNLELTRRRTP